MNTQGMISRISQRTAKLLGVTALALGLTATVAAPASAGTLPPPDLKGGVASPNTIELGTPVMVPIIVVNRGGPVAVPVEVRVLLSASFEDVRWRSAFGQGWTCPRAGKNQYGQWDLLCRTDGIDADSHKALLLTVTAHSDQNLWITAIADPSEQIFETNERNNVERLDLRAR